MSIGKGKLGKLQKVIAEDGESVQTMETRRYIESLYNDGAGMPISQIALKVGVAKSTVYYYLRRSRAEWIARNPDYSMERLSVWLDDSFNSASACTEVLQDTEWLAEAHPDRIVAVTNAFKTISEQILVAYAVAFNSQGSSEAKQNIAPVGG